MDHDELKNLELYIEEVRAKLADRFRLRELNLQTNQDYAKELERLDGLDSSIKKNAALVKRLKVFSESQKLQILDEIDRLNSTKFISEIATSIIEAKLKLSDIPSVIEISTKLNRSYREFSRQLLNQYVKYLPVVRRKANFDGNPQQATASGLSYLATSSKNTLHMRTNSPTNLVKTNRSNSNNLTIPVAISPSKLRVDLRLLAELIVTGILPLKESFSVLLNLLYFLMVDDKNVHPNANAILTFCKGCGDEFIGLVPKQIELASSKYDKVLPTSDFITVKRQELLRSYMHEYFRSLSRHVSNLHADLNQLIAKSKKTCKIRGEFSKELKDQVEAKQSEFQKVNNILSQLADLLDEQAPELESIDGPEGETSSGIPMIETSSSIVTQAADNESSIWDDDGTRSFYEELLNLKTLFPNLQVKAPSLKRKELSTSTKESEDVANETNEKIPESGSKLDKDNATGQDDFDAEQGENSSSSTESLNGVGTTAASCLQMAKSVADRVQPDQYFVKLSECVNRDMIDNAAIDFIRFFNTKFGRKKLIKTLFNVHRTRLDLLPFYARLTATIYPYVPSVGNELASLLRHEFRNLFRKKDQINIESKVKNVRYISELVKFDLYPKLDALDCLKSLLSDFTHHHIEMTCNLLEVCGRLLYKSQQSHHQMRLILEQMMRKKLLLSVDSKYVTMIENAYYFTNPPKVVKQVAEEDPIHMYVRYLLYDCLNRSTIDKVLKKIKLLDLEDKKLAKFVINCLTEAYNVKFYNIRYLAALLSALNKVHPWIPVAVIDGVVEDILLMIEINEVQFNQRRIPMIRYFGELYNYRLSDSSLVFKILYSLITYGVLYPSPEANLSQIPLSHLDPPDNLFRIKLICDLLETCGQYLSNGQEKRKLDCYLLFFQRYYWCKKHIFLLHPFCLAKSGDQFPASTEYLYNDTIRNLRPNFRMVTSYMDAIQSTQDFLNDLQGEQQSA